MKKRPGDSPTGRPPQKKAVCVAHFTLSRKCNLLGAQAIGSTVTIQAVILAVCSNLVAIIYLAGQNVMSCITHLPTVSTVCFFPAVG